MEYKLYPPAMSDNIWDYVYTVTDNSIKPSILEWGSGGSTIGFIEIIMKNGGKLRSIEDNYNFFNSMRLEIIKYIDKANIYYEYRQSSQDIKNFTNISIQKKEKFDIILIDSRDKVPSRMGCLEYVIEKNLLVKDGYLMIHDAFRYEKEIKKLIPRGSYLSGIGRFQFLKSHGIEIERDYNGTYDIENELYVWRDR